MNIQASNRLNSLAPYAFAEINKKVAALKALHAEGKAVAPIDFGVGDPSSPTPDFVIQAMTDIATNHAATGYPSYVGSQGLREAAARYMKKRFDVQLDPDTQVCSNIGSKEAIFNFPEAFLNPGDIVICPSPGYPPMKTGTIFAEGQAYFVPLLPENNFLIDYQSIPEEVAQKAKIIWLNYPNSPTGAIASKEYYQGLIKWARANNIIIAADEGCYIDIYFDHKPTSILQAAEEMDAETNSENNPTTRPYEGIVCFYSLSKRNNMTGYRAGFVCGDEEILSIYKRLKTNIDSGTPSIIQEAAILALDNDDHVEEMRQLYKEKGDILMDALKSIGLTVKPPAATFYIWQKVPDHITDIDFAKLLLEPETGIVVTPGSLISDQCQMPDGSTVNPGAGYVRFALMPTMQEMKEAAERIKSIQV